MIDDGKIDLFVAVAVVAFAAGLVARLVITWAERKRLQRDIRKLVARLKVGRVHYD